MMTMNIGMAVHLPVSSLSIEKLRARSLLSRGLTTVRDTMRPMKE